MRTRRILRRLTGIRRAREASELGTSAIHQSTLAAIARAMPAGISGDHLDVGSGTGELLRLVGARYSLRPFACDYTDRFMETPGQKVTVVDLDRTHLPFENDSFALVTCLEIIEHLENFRALIREVFRVLQPGGLAVFSTPNVLNLRSRFRYFSSGFYNLFGPLALNDSHRHGARGHVSPINWFYLGHALSSTGFTDLRVSVDKYQRRSFLAFALLLAPIRLSNAAVYRRDRKTYGTVNESNAWMVQLMNSRDLLLGRTVIVSARKPS